jgi:hypothetical protein
MTKLLNFLIITILIQFISVPLVSSFNIPADSEDVYQKSAEMVESNAQAKVSGYSYATNDEGHIQAIAASKPLNAPVQLEKEIIPNDNNSLIVNTPAKVWAEVQIAGKKLQYIQLLETIDSTIDVLNISKFYIVNTLSEVSRVKKAFEDPKNEDNYTRGIPSITIFNDKPNNFNIEQEFNNDTLYIEKYKKFSSIKGIDIMMLDNNTLFIEKKNIMNSEKIIPDNLEKKGKIIYWYYIIPHESGTHNIHTIVRTDDEYPDINQITKINVKEKDPKFEVRISGKKLELDDDEPLNIIYNIKYIGGSVDPYKCNISINKSVSEYTVLGNRDSYSNEIFRLNELKQKSFLIKYPEEGKYYLPELLIEGICERGSCDLNKYTFSEETIAVVGTVQKYNDFITWTILGICIIIAQIFGKEINEISKSIYAAIIGIRLFDPLIDVVNTRIFKPIIGFIKKLLKYKKR